MKTISRYIMTLALLLTAVTGAWAQTPSVKLFTVPAEWESDNTPLTAADLPADFVDYSTLTDDEAKAIPNPDPSYNHSIFLFYGFNENDVKYILWVDGTHVGKMTVSREDLYTETTQIQSKIYYTTGAAEPTIDVKWDAATKTGTFEMPAFDVEIAPIYAPVAQWAKDENVDQLPTAIEGVIADTDAPLIVEGTVAFAGTSTEVKQGTVMYAVTPATVTEAPALDAANKWSADVPTAKLVPDGGVDVKVWYYINGADTPTDEKATAENTFNDSEICTEPITVTVLSNKFDINFKAANDNTIETGKATVTAGGTTATVTEGKLEGVKMGSEVKVKAKDGYKFRKVEVKKKALLSIKITGPTNATIYYFEGETWEQAIQNHPTENSAWSIDQEGHISCNWYYLYAGDNLVNSNDTIAPNAGYRFPLS